MRKLAAPLILASVILAGCQPGGTPQACTEALAEAEKVFSAATEIIISQTEVLQAIPGAVETGSYTSGLGTAIDNSQRVVDQSRQVMDSSRYSQLKAECVS